MLDSHHINFENYTGEGIKIAIIDSGIDNYYKYNLIQKKDFITNSDNEICKDYIGHGTACAGILAKKAPKAELLIIKIFDKKLVTTYDLLIKSLKYAIEKNVNIINLSLGFPKRDDFKELYQICQYALQKNIIIIAAENKVNGKCSYPANFNNVLGVASGKIHSKFGYFYRSNSSIELIARGDNQRVNWLNGQSIFISGSSFAAANISGIIALIVQAFPKYNFSKIKKVLFYNSLAKEPELCDDEIINDNSTILQSSSKVFIKPDLSWIKNAVIYPYNKEMHSLIRFKELLPFDIISVFDDPAKLLIGKDSAEAIGLKKNNIIIKSINKINFSSLDFDTIILGYLDEIGRIKGTDSLNQIILEATNHNKNIYSLSNLPNELTELLEKGSKSNVIFRYPYVDGELLKKINEREDLLNQKIDTPRIAIFGTGPQQGKFTTQMTLFSELKKGGLKVGNISTEHQSELFNVDFTFPMGYGNSVNLPLNLYPVIIRGIIAELEPHNYDIIILAGQSGIIPFEINSFSSWYTLPSIAFLFGANADAFILCINYFDDDNFIMDSIRGLEILGKSKVILIVFSDHAKILKTTLGYTRITYRKLSTQEINNKISYLESKFGISATEVVSANGKKKLLAAVIKYFS